jgi:hypothetical protein
MDTTNRFAVIVVVVVVVESHAVVAVGPRNVAMVARFFRVSQCRAAV